MVFDAALNKEMKNSTYLSYFENMKRNCNVKAVAREAMPSLRVLA